jgi:hypothetical protein
LPLSLEQLVGRWQQENTPGEARYPDSVEFFKDGTYRAASKDRRSDWDEASFDILDALHLRVQTAWDRKTRYTASIEGDRLTIDDGQHRVTYRRVGS